jgi:hypothetical protein
MRAFTLKNHQYKDTQKPHEYRAELNDFKKRMQYIDGLHVNPTYTTIDHYWLIKQKVKLN